MTGPPSESLHNTNTTRAPSGARDWTYVHGTMAPTKPKAVVVAAAVAVAVVAVVVVVVTSP